jgi:CBS domain-containing protein
MARTVKEIMNAELFSVRTTDTLSVAREGLLALGVSSAPVLDPAGRPVGVVSLHQLVRGRDGESVLERMTVPAPILDENATMTEAAHLIGQRDHVHVVVVDDGGRAVGIVSAADVLRALVGMPVQHPGTFPHVDPLTHLTWTDDAPLDDQHADTLPDGPGLIALIDDRPWVARRIVWVESAVDIQARILDMLDLPQESPELSRWLRYGPALRFRVASVPDDARRRTALEALRAHVRRHALEAHGLTPSKEAVVAED